MNLKKVFFWQPKTDFLRLLNLSSLGKKILIVLNYSIWFFLFYVSYRLIRFQTNIFWQILFATIAGEIVERLVKSKIYWRRPLFVRHDKLPDGLVKGWYKTGSFPSGHTIKAVYFLLFILQYQSSSPTLFLLVTVPLLLFRVLIGFHYPIDLLGGGLIGIVLWQATHTLVAPAYLNDIIKTIFNFVFFIKS
ncbi:phosphatase PAP2 family protein [Candidatus Shapirobacteria bacterium]|nr:phosphatase PAP2 family protein [Candidatus Shapirobacteria bacterium]